MAIVTAKAKAHSQYPKTLPQDSLIEWIRLAWDSEEESGGPRLVSELVTNKAVLC